MFSELSFHRRVSVAFQNHRYWKGCYRVSVDAFLVTEAFRWGGVDE